jgi:hypothetical protein
MTNCHCLAIATRQAAFSRTGIEISAVFRRQHLALRHRAPQQPNVNKMCFEIHVIYQLVDQGGDNAANLAAFAGACPLLAAALRGTCH